MFLSVFDLFKIGVGPSSSHTMGPMVAAGRFLDRLRALGPGQPLRLAVSLHGSLAFTGKGHATDRAVCLGLLGETPSGIDPDSAEGLLTALAETKTLRVPELPPLRFDPAADLAFDFERQLPGHTNGMIFRALTEEGAEIAEAVYYSIGGGFVAEEAELGHAPGETAQDVPYPFGNAAELLAMGDDCGKSIAAMTWANECAVRGEAETEAGLDAIWQAMDACMERGLSQEGELPGGLQVQRRAAAIYRKLEAARGDNRRFEHAVMDWLSVFAMAGQ